MLFVFDENFSYRVPEALNLLEQGDKKNPDKAQVRFILHLGKELNVPFLSGRKSYTDEQVIEIVGSQNGIIITQDNDFRRMKHKADLYAQHNVGVIFIRTYKESTGYWRAMSWIIDHWLIIKRAIEESKPPYCFKLSKSGIKPYSFNQDAFERDLEDTTDDDV